MAFVVVTSLLGIVDHQLLRPHSPLNYLLDDKQVNEIAASLSNKLRFLQAILLEKKTVNQQLAATIRDVVVGAEAEIESQLRAVHLAAHNNGDSVIAEARSGLHKTLEQVLIHIKTLEDRIQNQKEGNAKDKVIGCEDEFRKLKSMFKEVLIRLLHCTDPTASKIYSEDCDADNFQKLCLILKFCRDLKKLPIDSFGDTLQLIEIDSCYPSLVKSAKKIQEEQQYYGNYALVIRDLGAKMGLPYNENSEKGNEEFDDFVI
nr:putative late blight resistance protein homolog R1B-14 [Ipomoea batatas]